MFILYKINELHVHKSLHLPNVQSTLISRIVFPPFLYFGNTTFDCLSPSLVDAWSLCPFSL